jgi:hypothetical protein
MPAVEYFHPCKQQIADSYTEYNIVGYIFLELLDATNAAPVAEDKTLYIEAALDQLFLNYDWTTSFTKPQLIIYDELLPSEILIVIHKWLRKKSADIENITLAVTHHTGVTTWWMKWCETFNEKSFNVIDVLSSNAVPAYWVTWPKVKKLSKLELIKQKQFSTLFNFYGGKLPRRDNQYFLFKILELAEYGIIDYIANVITKPNLIAYAESITYYKNQKEIDELSESYDRYTVNSRLIDLSKGTRPILDKNTDSSQLMFGLWEIDRLCFCTVIRDPIQSDVYSCFNEKILRAFSTHLTALPAGVNAVRDLEEMGFWFPHEIIDYSYSSIPDYAKRITALVTSLRECAEKYSLNDLRDFYIENFDKYQANATLVFDLTDAHPLHPEKLK